MSKNTPVKMKKTTAKICSKKSFIKYDNNFNDLFSEYVREVSNYPVLTSAEELELAKSVKDGDMFAKKQLVQSNLRLVISIANKVIHVSGIPMLDLIQEGNLGLMVAVEKFNYKLGYKFATYASWWIKQAMFKAISEQSHCMKIPVYIQETLSKFSKIKTKMEQEYNCQVKTRDVAKKMNISTEKIESFLSAYTKTVSIEGGIERNDGKDINIADILEDERASVYRDIEERNLQEDIESVISTLKERERDVVRMRFGLGNEEKRTLEEIGNIYGVTKECIRQTEMRALEKMRNSELGQELLIEYLR